MNDKFPGDPLFDGLKALAEAAFPKRCPSCGRTFDDARQFLAETDALRQGASGLKQSVDDDAATIVEVYRNCSCGSTLMDFFSNRRDATDAGAHRRRLFEKVMSNLESKGMTRAEGRAYLLRMMRGDQDDALAAEADTT
jgi:hypothetical protein